MVKHLFVMMDNGLMKVSTDVCTLSKELAIIYFKVVKFCLHIGHISLYYRRFKIAVGFF